MDKKINIIIPLGGKNPLFPKNEFPYSKLLVEIDKKSMIQLAIENLQSLHKNLNFIFLVKSEDCKNYFLDSVLELLTKNKPTIIKIDNDTKGAVCTALLAIDHIDNDTPLLICNGDQIIKEDLNKVVNYFDVNCDVGLISINAIHPRWSFIRTNGDKVVETSEKRPISNNAIAGFFYYKKGSYFIESAMQVIKKDANYKGMYYIASTINELILENKDVRHFKIVPELYECFYSPEKINEYKNRLIKS